MYDEFTQKLLILISTYIKVIGLKNQGAKSISIHYFYTLTIKSLERELRNNSIYINIIK